MLLKRKYLFGTTILAGVMAATAPALAQETQLPGVNVQGQQDQEATEIEAVVVTGSRIRRDPTTAPTPLIQVEGEDLLTTGLSTVIDYLATIPALSNSLVPSDTTGSGLNDSGLSLPNLRSLGTGRTLTLVDGRRHVSSSAGSLAVDVDTIPRLLIENIEIITGGASSVYGADAVSGVLNFNLRKDFEGLEIDGNVAMINEDGQTSKRISALIGRNFLDDRLNVYGHAEYEQQDEVKSLDLDWLRAGYALLPNDMDPTSPAVGPNVDGVTDFLLFRDLRRLDRPRWGQTTLFHPTPGSPATDPDLPSLACTAINDADCFYVQPGLTYWYDGPTARLANFGQRVGNSSGSTTSASQPYNIGGDGENPAIFSTETRVPRSESSRFQVGANFEVTDNITAYVEAKYVTEESFDVAQPTFFDINLWEGGYAANSSNPIRAISQFDLRWSDNAFLPQNVKDAIAANVQPGFGAAPYARHQMFGPQRSQTNEREVQRYVAALTGSYDEVIGIRNFNWDVSYTFGEMNNVNNERGVDVLRFALAADAVVDLGGVLGTPGAIVCRSTLLTAQNPNINLPDYASPVGDFLRDTPEGRAAVDECQPLNVFGAGNQSEEALNYVDASINVRETNRQHNAIAAVSGELFDPWGAGPIGVAAGVEWRKEYTEGVGRSADTGNRTLFLNTGPDFPGTAYESKEAFAELSIPLFRDSWLGEYAELSGSYRISEYSTVGNVDVYGINLVYRPIQDIAFKTSFNTSTRIPQLGENFRPLVQTFANGFVDPCATGQIGRITDLEIRGYRIENCTELAAQYGFTFDFEGATATTADDYVPSYTSGVAGLTGGNPDLRPESSESFTFSTVIQPRFFPDLSIVLDYYDIVITDVIATPSAQGLAEQCVSSGPDLNPDACDFIFRNIAGVTPNERFRVGNPGGSGVGFIQSPINFAKLETTGLDFTVNYSLDTEEVFGRNWGRFDYSVGGLWLIDQDNFTSTTSPNVFTALASTPFYPRVRFTSRLTWSPTETVAITWTADWQTSQDISQYRNFVNDIDSQPVEYLRTGDFVRNDLAVRWDVTDDVTLRAGVTNLFDAEQAPWLGQTLYSNFDPYGRRFNIGVNYRVW